MTEELRLQQGPGYRGAIHRHEGLAAARAGIVDAPGEELFARAGLSHQEDGGAPPAGHLLGHRHSFHEGEAATYQALESEVDTGRLLGIG